MPTENRSSNTEPVSVPEGFKLVERSIWTEQQVEAATACITRLKGVPGMRDRDLAMAAIDAAQCKAPEIALSDVLPAQQHQGEPVALPVRKTHKKGNSPMQNAKNSAWNACLDEITKLGPLYTHPAPADTAEVERLRAALRFYADREHFHFESGNWDTVSGEPLNILWCGNEPDFIEDGTVARNALSARRGNSYLFPKR
ncbi:hypothetical protein [Pseudomonas sp. REB1044]|uniref:hypothetical protein n=1 Tax=Pseudomonas sp. REB1044 TaxID=2675224 RepID=UPI00315D18C1